MSWDLENTEQQILNLCVGVKMICPCVWSNHLNMRTTYFPVCYILGNQRIEKKNCILRENSHLKWVKWQRKLLPCYLWMTNKCIMPEIIKKNYGHTHWQARSILPLTDFTHPSHTKYYDCAAWYCVPKFWRHLLHPSIRFKMEAAGSSKTQGTLHYTYDIMCHMTAITFFIAILYKTT